jgi:hypothetical protein
LLERVSGQFTIEGSVEDIFGGISGATRIARISQTCLFTGALQGDSIAEYTAVLPRNGDGAFQGFQRISGALGEREGTFVVCVTGEYAKGQPRGSWTIVPKSGSGDFVHIRGGGTFSQSPGKAGSYKLEFDLRKPRKARDSASIAGGDSTELVPGIDIAEDISPTPEIEIDVIAPPDEPAIAKQPRRTRKKQEPAEPVVVETVTAGVTPKRSRKKTAPVVVEVVAGTPATESAPNRERSRKKASPVVEEPFPANVEPAPKRRSTRTKASVEHPAVEPAPAAEPPRKRARKPATSGTSEPVAVDPTPVAKVPRKSARKTAPAEAPAPASAESASAGEPKRRRKTASPPPEPVPIAQNTPTRQRKAKAA